MTFQGLSGLHLGDQKVTWKKLAPQVSWDEYQNNGSHRIHVWYTHLHHLHLPYKSTIHVGVYTSPMDPMGFEVSPT